MFCNRCGNLLPAQAATCPACNNPISRIDAGPVEIGPDLAKRAQDFVGRNWAVDAIRAWAYQGQERYYLLTGEPGSGKTALAAWLAGAGPPPADTAQAQGLVQVRGLWDAAHFCIASTHGGSLDPTNFSRELARQLSARLPDYAEGVLLTHDPTYQITQEVRENLGQVVGVQIQNFIVNSNNAPDTFNRLVREPMKFLAERRPGVRVFILVDALDEALARTPPNIVTLLAGSGDLEGVRFLLTSRNDQRVLMQFPGAARLNLSGAQHAADNEDDLWTYVRRRLEKMQKPAALGAYILACAEGNFLYTEFVLDELESGRRQAGEPAPLPGSLFGLYQGYLSRLVPDMLAVGQSARWTDEYQPLLGSVSVASPAAPQKLLPDWSELDAGIAGARLADLAQLTEYVPGELAGLQLYHRSMAEFLDMADYEEDAAPQSNLYYTPAFEQHGRIIRHYQTTFQQAWDECDGYGLHRLGAHLRARLALARNPKQRQQAAEALYAHTLDDGFRKAQIEKMGDVQAALDDLRLTVEIALQRGDLLKALQFAGIYRHTLRSSRIVEGIFEAVDQGNPARARKRASYFGISPRPRGRWAEVLQLYLAWEAAERGQVDEVGHLFESAERLPPLWSSPLADALRVRVARSLARRTPERTAQQWLVAMATYEDADALLARFTEAQPPDPAQRDGLIAEMSRWLDGYQFLIEDQPSDLEAPIMYALDVNLEGFAGPLQDRLVPLAADPAGRQGIRRALDMLRDNAYARYRDIGLAAAGVACLAVPEPGFVRECLRRILTTALRQETVVFALDLPAHLEAEAARRSLPADTPGLAAIRAYQACALGSKDSWGSALRAHSAAATALFWQGHASEAWQELGRASEADGFSGLLSVGMLSLAGRCQEFGDADRAGQSVWGGQQYATLPALAAVKADRVRDPVFRQERLDLVARFGQWWAEPAPNLEAAQSRLSEMPDPDVRRAWDELASARWAAPVVRDERSLAGLLPVLLNDGTALDAAVGRLVGPRLQSFSNDDLVEAIRLCADYFLDDRPWDLAAPSRELG